jgi:hypothetical protein
MLWRKVGLRTLNEVRPQHSTVYETEDTLEQYFPRQLLPQLLHF